MLFRYGYDFSLAYRFNRILYIRLRGVAVVRRVANKRAEHAHYMDVVFTWMLLGQVV